MALTQGAGIKSKWDVSTRSVTSAFSWRGQFTPDLVGLAFDDYDTGKGLVLDPFMGSGTVVLEAIKRSREVAGFEINPGAFILSEVFKLAEISKKNRESLLLELKDFIDSLSDGEVSKSIVEKIIKLSKQSKRKHFRILSRALLLIAMGDTSSISHLRLKKAFQQLEAVILDLPKYEKSSSIEIADARRLPLEDRTVGFVVTSPPYINVFNYHQNYRAAVELLGYDVLTSAKSEIGANRKFRSNRIFTVVQYCIDMSLVISELARVMMPGAIAVMIVGKESNVRGMPFKNAAIIKGIIEGSDLLLLKDQFQRKFTSRFGTVVYEEILVFERNKRAKQPKINDVVAYSRQIASEQLHALIRTQSGDKLKDLQEAVNRIESIEQSPFA